MSASEIIVLAAMRTRTIDETRRTESFIGLQGQKLFWHSVSASATICGVSDGDGPGRNVATSGISGARGRTVGRGTGGAERAVGESG
jgi:hypothetical protein